MIEKEINEEFLKLCRQRNFEKLKEIYDENKITDETIKIGFNDVCLDYNKIIDEIFEIFKNKKFEAEKFFRKEFPYLEMTEK